MLSSGRGVHAGTGMTVEGINSSLPSQELPHSFSPLQPVWLSFLTPCGTVRVSVDLLQLTVAWKQLHALARCHRPNDSEAHYNRVLLALDTLLTKDGEQPLADLVEIQRVTTYEDRAGHVPPAAPDLELRLIVQERGVISRHLPRQSAFIKG